MKLIDIDQLESVESHIHYRKNYSGRAIIMDSKSEILRFQIQFSIEYKPLGDHEIKVKFLEHPHFPIVSLLKKIKEKITDLDSKGVLADIK